MSKANRPTAFVLVGPPGAGKSTWRTHHLDRTLAPTEVISTDDLIEAWGLDHGMTYSEAFGECDLDSMERTAKALFAEAVARGDDVIIDRTNMTEKSRRRWLSSLPKTYHRVAVVFEVPRNVLDERLARRAASTGKRIPARVIDDMLASYVAPTLEEFDDIRSP